jgi:hypothetical protein
VDIPALRTLLEDVIPKRRTVEAFEVEFASAANDLTVAGSIATPFTKLDEVEQMKTLEDSSLDFYTMLRSVVAQKRQAELDEAVARSGWTALRNSKSAPRTSSRPSRPASPKQSEIMASALTGPD